MVVLNLMGELPHDVVDGKSFDQFKDIVGKNPFKDVPWDEVTKGITKSEVLKDLLRKVSDKRERREMKEKARAMAVGLTSGFHQYLATSMFFLANQAGRYLYNGLYVEEEQYIAFRELAKKAHNEGKSLVLLPSHKSHVDYVAVHCMLLRLGIALPSVAAGDNLDIPLVGSVLRRIGAFFIRRSFGGPDGELYTAVVTAYLHALLGLGVNIEFFPEGGRSRTGKLLQPKVGMLGMVMKALLDGGVDDAYVVPISIQYDRLMESGDYANELLGAKKQKESVVGFFGQMGSLAQKSRPLGSIQIRIAKGFSLRQYINEHSVKKETLTPWNPKTNRTDRHALYRSAAYKVMDDINGVSVITPSSLVGTVLLTTRGRGVGREELIKRVEWLRDEVVRDGGSVSWPGGPPGDIVDDSLVVLGDLIEKHPLFEPVYSVTNHLEMSFYRNMLVHVFSEKAIIAASLHSFMRHEPDRKFVTREELRTRTGRLSRLLRYEFVFSGNTGRIRSQPGSGHGAPVPSAETPLETNFRLATDSMISGGVLRTDKADPNKILLFSTDPELWSPTFTFLCMLVWPFIEGYWLCLVGFEATFDRHRNALVREEQFLLDLQQFAQLMFRLGNLNFFESISKEPLRHALQTYLEFGVVVRRVIEDSTRKTVSYIELGPELKLDTKGLLSLEDEVRIFRRQGKFQKDLEVYPSDLAKLAFQHSRAAKM